MNRLVCPTPRSPLALVLALAFSLALALALALAPAGSVRPVDASGIARSGTLDEATSTPPTESATGPVERIAFGSCLKPDRPQHVWDAIRRFDPDVWIWLGDSVYADVPSPNTGTAEGDAAVALERLPKLYADLSSVAGYRALGRRARILGTWDDHDYGHNDAGAEFPGKARSQELFLDFLGEPANSERRSTPGVYAAYELGPEGRRVQILLLDTRTFRSPLRSEPNPPENWTDGRPGSYLPLDDPDATMLGEAQWRWLEAQLERPADLRVIASSIQVVANDHRFEKWGNLPRERRRLLKLVRETGADGVVFLSGDRHSGEISRLDPRRAIPGSFADVGYPIYDLTSSALTNSAPTAPGEDGAVRSDFVQYSDERNRHRIGSQVRYNNFGTLEIDWDAPGGARLRMRLHTDRGEELIREVVRLDALRPGGD